MAHVSEPHKLDHPSESAPMLVRGLAYGVLGYWGKSVDDEPVRVIIGRFLVRLLGALFPPVSVTRNE